MPNRFFLLMFLVWTMLASAALGGRASNYHEFAHVADGGGIRTSFLVLNSHGQPAHVNFSFLQDDGNPWNLSIGGAESSTLFWAVPPGGMVKISTDGAGAMPQQGWARMTSNRSVGAQSFFEILSDDQLVTQAAVESSGPMRNVDLFVEQSEDTSTGLALVSLSQNGTTRVVLTLKNEAGETVATAELVLGPLNHLARFLPALIEGIGNLRGTLALSASGPIAVVTLQQSGLVLGTLPVVVRSF